MRHNSEKKVPFEAVIFIISVPVVLMCIFPVFAAKNGDNARTKSKITSNEKSALETSSPKAVPAENTKDLPLKEYSEDDFKPQVEEESYFGLVFKTLIILLLLVGGFYYFFRFVSKKAGIPLMGHGGVHILSIVPLGQNKYLQIVDLAGKILVLGVADNSINLITEIKEKDEIDRIRLQGSQTVTGPRSGFQEYIMKNIGRIIERVSEKRGKSGKLFSPANMDEESYEPGTDFSYLKNQRQRLKNLDGAGDE